MRPINIIVVDDHKIMRDGIRSMLLGRNDIKIIGEAAHGYQLLESLKENDPDVIVLDIALPKMSGIEIAKILSKEYPRIKILVLTASTDEQTLKAAIKAGVPGFLSKDTSKEEFIEAVRVVHFGQHYFGTNISNTIHQILTNSLNENTSKKDEELSNREIEIIKLFAEGLTYKEIAESLYISARTVETHKNNILKKLGLKNTIGLVKYAIKERIIEL